jgi:hypothetical protein
MPKGTFRVIEATESMTKTNKRMLRLKLKLPTAQGGTEIPGVMWEEGLVLAEQGGEGIPKPGDIWKEATYKEDSFKGEVQYQIRKFETLRNPEPAQIAFFRDPSAIDVDAAYNEMFFWSQWTKPFETLFQNIHEEFLKNDQVSIVKAIPAGAKNHHSVRGGLLQHILEMEAIATQLCGYAVGNTIPRMVALPRFEKPYIHFQLLRASIILHDIGKVHDYDPELLSFDQDEEGSLMEHSQWAALLIERNWPSGSDQDQLKQRLQHCVLAHHGRSIAAVAPKIPEAMLLHQIDALSAYSDVYRRTQKQADAGKQIPFNMMIGGAPLPPLG